MLVSGEVHDTEGSAVRGRRVRLMTRLPGEPTWTRVAEGVSARDGRIVLSTPTLAQNTIVQLRVGTVRSVRLKVVAVPTVAASVSENTLTVSTVGGLPGDQVALLRWRDGVLVQLDKLPLSSESTTSFEVDPPGERAVRYVVRLLRTKQHAAARAGLTVPRAAV